MALQLEIGKRYIVRVGPMEYPIFYLATLLRAAGLPQFYTFKAELPEAREITVHASFVSPDTEEGRRICLKLEADGHLRNSRKQ